MNHMNLTTKCFAWLGILSGSLFTLATDVGTAPAARYSGTFGVRFSIFNSAFGYLQDDTPSSETRYRARFYVNLENLNLAAGDQVQFLSGTSQSERPQFSITVVHRNGQPGLTMGVALDNQSTVNLPPSEDVPFGPGYHLLEVDWLSGNGTGHLRLWLDEELVASLEGLTNVTARMDMANLGIINEPSPTVSGYIDVDDFMSDGSDYIGPLPCGAIYQYQFAQVNWNASKDIQDMVIYISNPCF